MSDNSEVIRRILAIPVEKWQVIDEQNEYSHSFISKTERGATLRLEKQVYTNRENCYEYSLWMDGTVLAIAEKGAGWFGQVKKGDPGLVRLCDRLHKALAGEKARLLALREEEARRQAEAEVQARLDKL